MLRASLLAAASVLAMTSAASAQDVSATAGPAEEATQVSEVVITLQKREQQTVDVPAAVTAYGGDFLEEIGVTDFEELSYFTPGFEVQNQSPNNPAFVVRGITSDSGTSVTENRVSIFQDGVSISRARGAYIELHDIARVEVAKGPQSTLFGRGALIGAVNVIQNKAELGGYDYQARVGYGNLDYKLAEGMVNLPLGDTFAVRVSGRYKDRDGFIDNLLGGDDFNSQNVATGRLALRWEPNERLTADLIFNHLENDTAGTSFKSNTFFPTSPTVFGPNPPFGVVLGDLSPNSGAALSSATGFKGGRALGLERSLSDATALVTYELNDALTLNSITAYREFDSSEVFDPDGTSLPILVFAEDAVSEQVSQELRLNYDAGGRVRGFVGVNYFDEAGSQTVPGQFDERLVVALNGGSLIPLRPNLPTIDGVVAALSAATSPVRALVPALKPIQRETFANFGETTSYDVYADVAYDLTPQVEVTAGLRYTTDDKSSAYQATLDNGGSAFAALSRGLPLGSAVGLVFQPTEKVTREFEDEGVTFRFAGRYQPNDEITFYGSFARGRQPEVVSPSGGTIRVTAPGQFVINPVSFTELPAEEVDSYEAGLKGVIPEARLRFETSAYFYAYRNFQSSQVNAAGQVVAFNGGEAEARGFEAQADYDAAEWLQLFGTYAFNRFRFQNGIVEGNQGRSAPDHSLSVGARLTAATGLGEFVFTPTYAYQSKTFFDIFNDERDRVQDEFQDGYGLLNARLKFTPAGRDNVEIALFADNLTDEDFIIDAGNTGDGFGIPTFIAGEPRTYGVTVSIRR
jgi:outer membrane receptor protein involved in Fe transport